MRPISDLQRRVEPFQVISEYVPAGDQPAAIAEITKRINAGEKDVVLARCHWYRKVCNNCLAN